MKAEEPIQWDPRDEQAYRVAYLIAGYVRETLTESEHEELDNWVTASMDNQRLFEELSDERKLEKLLAWKNSLPTPQVLDKLKGKLDFASEREPSRFRWWPYAVAASVAAILITTALLFQRNSGKNSIKPNELLVKDIAPGASRAILTLSDGTNIILESAKKGTLTREGDVTITKNDSGQLSYGKSGISDGRTPVFNTIRVPKGGQYRLTLPDGTQVWLNAASSLQYPTFFAGGKRRIALTGEGYFDIAPDAAHPFVVDAGGGTIQVLGTQFDINAYSDEPNLRVTLSEGAIKVNDAVVLKPGQQAQVAHGGAIKTVLADLETTLAWKNGQFLFKEAPLEDILRQAARWYNADISFQANITEHFNADIPRSVPASKLLHLLEGTGSVHFKIEDKKIIVMK